MDWDNTPWNAEPGALLSDRNYEYYEATYTREEEEDVYCFICGDNTVGLVKVGYQWICENCESQAANTYDPDDAPHF